MFEEDSGSAGSDLLQVPILKVVWRQNMYFHILLPSSSWTAEMYEAQVTYNLPDKEVRIQLKIRDEIRKLQIF